jgi:hypothetical protein
LLELGVKYTLSNGSVRIMSTISCAKTVALVTCPPTTTERNAAGNIPATPKDTNAIIDVAIRSSTSVRAAASLRGLAITDTFLGIP